MTNPEDNESVRYQKMNVRERRRIYEENLNRLKKDQDEEGEKRMRKTRSMQDVKDNVSKTPVTSIRLDTPALESYETTLGKADIETPVASTPPDKPLLERYETTPGKADIEYCPIQRDVTRTPVASIFPDKPSLERYETTPGKADIAGQLFEIKLSALFFLFGIKLKKAFRLLSNAKFAGLFDDVVFDVEGTDPSFFIQLKHKQKANLYEEMFLSTSGEFSLMKYLDSYRKIKGSFATKPKDFEHSGPFESFKFVIFTNACINKALYSDIKEVKVEEEDLFGTGGKLFYIHNESKISKRLKEQLKEILRFQSYLKAIKSNMMNEKKCVGPDDPLYYAQAIPRSLIGDNDWKNKEVCDKMTQLTKTPFMTELDTILKWKAFELLTDDVTCDEFLNSLLICTDQPNEAKLDDVIKKKIQSLWIPAEQEVQHVFRGLIDGLTDWWRKGHYVLHSTSHIWTKSLHRSKREKLSKFAIKFDQKSADSLAQTIKTYKPRLVLLLIEKNLTTLTSIKLLQSLDMIKSALDKTIFVSLDTLMENEDKVLAAWRSTWCNTLIVECGTDVAPIKAMELGGKLKDIADVQSKKIVLLTKKDHCLATEMKKWILHDVCQGVVRWHELSLESQKLLQSKEINFQGIYITLGELIKDNEELASMLDGVTLELLLEDKLQLGRNLEDPITRNVSRSLLTSTGSKPVKVLADMDDKLVLVTGLPGMGKSTLLTELGEASKRQDPHLWIVRLNLTECSKYLRKLELDDVIDGIHFLQEFAYNFDGHTQFEEALFSCCLNHNKMVMLLDGFDEISPDYDKKMLTILQKLPKQKFYKLWVTSRSVTKVKIEKALNVKASELMPFTREDQTDFLIGFWKNAYCDIDEDCIKLFVDGLLQLADKTFTDENFLTGVPLLIEMMAEIFRTDLENYNQDTTNFPETLDLLRLYDGFVTRKHEIYSKEKKKLDRSILANNFDEKKNFVVFQKNHMQASLLFLLSPDEYRDIPIENRKQTLEELEAFCSEIRDGNEKTGIIDGIDSSGRLHFIHRTFCEYFVAIWIYKNYGQVREFVKKKTCDPKYKVVNDILNRILARDSPLHVCVLNRDLNGIKNLLGSGSQPVDYRDAGGRTALLLVSIIWDSNHRSIYLDIARFLLDHGASSDAIEDVFEWRPLQFADKNRAWTLAGLILQKGGNSLDLLIMTNYMKEEVFSKFIIFLQSPDSRSIADVMKLATKHGDTVVVRYLIEERDCLPSWKDKDGVTLMHYASESGSVDLMMYLYEKGVSYTERDEGNNLPVHFAANAGEKFVVKYLIEMESQVDALNDKLETPLLIAAGSAEADEEVIKYLLTKDADINACSADGSSALSLSAKCGKLEMVKLLIRQGIDVAKFRQAAVKCASENGKEDIVQYLQEGVNNIASQTYIFWTENKKKSSKLIITVGL